MFADTCRQCPTARHSPSTRFPAKKPDDADDADDDDDTKQFETNEQILNTSIIIKENR